MKLYATVSSERATKGQGGNKKIEVLLQVDPQRRLEVGRLVMTYEENAYRIYYYPINENCQEQELNCGRVLLYETKGEKQKGEVCEYCQANGGYPCSRHDGSRYE